MRKKIMAFVFAAGLLMALAVPLVGGGGTVLAAHGAGVLSQNNVNVEADISGGVPVAANDGNLNATGAFD